MEVEKASAFGERFGRRFGSWSPRYQKVMHNLRLAFPEQPESWIEATAEAIWGEVGRNIAEYPHLPAITKEGRDTRIEVVDHADTAALRSNNRGIVFVAAHLGNWNVPAAIGNLLGFPLSVLYRRRKNTYVEAVIEHWRNQMKSGFIDADASASKSMMALLKRGECVGLYIDRRASSDEDVMFFGRRTPTSIIPARLALKTKAAYVPVRVERLPDVRFRITLYPSIEPPAAADDLRAAAKAMTEEANRHIEAWVRERPAQWICTSKRWPRSHAA